MRVAQGPENAAPGQWDTLGPRRMPAADARPLGQNLPDVPLHRAEVREAVAGLMNQDLEPLRAEQFEASEKDWAEPIPSGVQGGNHILTLDEAPGVLPRSDVPEGDIAL